MLYLLHGLSLFPTRGVLILLFTLVHDSSTASCRFSSFKFQLEVALYCFLHVFFTKISVGSSTFVLCVFYSLSAILRTCITLRQKAQLARQATPCFRAAKHVLVVNGYV